MEKTSSRRILSIALVLFGLFVLIAAPSVITGYWEVRQGDRAVSLGNRLDAARHYEAAGRLLAWEPCLFEQAARAALEGGDLQYGIQLFVQATRGGRPLSLDGWVAFGDAYQQSGDLPSAMAVWEEALNRSSEDSLYNSPARLYDRLAHAYRLTGDYAAEKTALDRWLQLEPNNPDAHYQLGLLLAATQPEEALPELMLAAALDPNLDAPVQTLRVSLNTALLVDDPAYHLVMAGRALGAVGEWDLAAEAFRRAILLLPEYAEAWAWLGEAYQHMGRDGLLYLEEALALKPDSAMNHAMYGLYWQRQNQPYQALTAFHVAAELEPENPAWQAALGEVYAQAGDLILASSHYQRAVALAPQDPVYWRVLAAFCIQYNVQVTEVGLPAALWTLALAPDDWRSLDVVGQAMMAAGDYDGAEYYFLRAVQAAPDEATLHLHLGWLYLQMSRPALAHYHLEKARALDPHGPFGAQAERLLEQNFP